MEVERSSGSWKMLLVELLDGGVDEGKGGIKDDIGFGVWGVG